MEEQFVPYELEVKLKKLGCDKDFSNGNHIGILWQQAFDWFRTEHNLHFEIFQTPASSHWNMCVYNLSSRFKTEKTYYNFISYEEARLECLKRLIELVKD